MATSDLYRATPDLCMATPDLCRATPDLCRAIPNFRLQLLYKSTILCMLSYF